ncbi:MAG: flavin reductase family protein [Alphaproteobacteria bacterium]|nr:flavin reductase family protein [Alphaproteobacteria bacterium]
MFYEPKNPHGLRRNPFKSLVVPRPIGWISSVSRDGRVNLAPFSYFNAVAHLPPIVLFGCNGHHLEGGNKDTLDNVLETGEFVVNICTYELREKMSATSEHLPRDVNEMALAGLEPAPSRLVRPPRVAASPVNLECRVITSVKLPQTDPEEPNTTVFGEVIGIHISEDIITDGMIDMTKFRPIARLGYHDYTVVDTVFTMRRPG